MFETPLQDLRYGVRSLRRSPGFATVAVLALALGIGASTAIFSVVNAVLLRPLPYADPGRLMLVWRTSTVDGSERIPVAMPDFRDWREQSRVFEETAAFASTEVALQVGDESIRVQGAVVTSGMFRVLGVSPSLGRPFLPEEDVPGGAQVVIVSHRLWQQSFGADPGIIGRTVVAEGRPFTVVGVMPPEFKFLGQSAGVVSLAERDYWVPFGVIPREFERGFNFLTVLARLRQGVTVDGARAEMSAIARALEQEHPETNTGAGAGVVPLSDAVVAGVRPALLVLLGAVGLVMLIACANVANLLLVRAASRQREIAIRSAIGASRWRVVRQLFTESLLLGASGGALGLLLAVLGLDTLLRAAPPGLPRLDEIAVDVRVFGFAVVLSLATGILFGLAPALHAARPDLVSSLREGSRSASTGPRRGRLRGALVVSEVALALVLLMGAGLLIRSFAQLLRTDAGFQAERVVTLEVSLPSSQYGEEHGRTAFFAELIDRIESLPGVASAGAVSALPLTGADRSTVFQVVGRAELPPAERSLVSIRLATPDYFQAMGISLLRGRMLTRADDSDAPPVVLINETMARRHFPGEDPIGKRIRIGWNEPREREIVGVVNDVRHFGLDSDRIPETYLPFGQETELAMTVAVRTSADPSSLAPAIREEVRQLDRTLALSVVRPMREILSESIAPRRFNMQLMGTFAAVALLLALVGIYGVISYSVTQRLPEIGIRMALGAHTHDVLRLVVGQGFKLVVIGLVVGMAAALALTRLMTSLLYGVSPADPATFACVALLLAAVALLASYLPARRAARADPVAALRAE